MRIEDFDYELPEELIARHPAPERSGSRLLLIERASGKISHHRFSDLPELLAAGDLVVANRSRVMPARVYARKPTGGEVELLLLERAADQPPGTGGESWLVLARGAARLKPGTELRAEDARAVVEGRAEEKVRLRIYTGSGESVPEWADRVGELPLPPYLERKAEAADRERYQTVFARESGSVAAPTAGLHFDAPTIERLREREIGFETLRLDVGWGTFAPIRTEDVREHRLHAEPYEISVELAGQIEQRRTGSVSGRVVAVGTTVTRSLEAAFAESPPRLTGRTGLYITPGYEFRVVQALITNFHLPRTSLLVLAAAFAGRELMIEAYRQAVAERYRFYSYGDCMLIL